MIAAYREAEAELPARAPRGPRPRCATRLDVEASLDDLAGIASVIRRATERSVRIVQNLRNFSRVSGEAVPTDLHAGLEETLLLLGPRLRHGGVDVVRRFGELPAVVCRAEEMNQIFMNLLVNAHPGAGAGERAPSPRIDPIETRVEGDSAVVTIADNGPGVPDPLEQRDLRSVLHHEAPRTGDRPRALHLDGHRAPPRRHALAAGAPRTAAGARFACRIPLASRP